MFRNVIALRPVIAFCAPRTGPRTDRRAADVRAAGFHVAVNWSPVTSVADLRDAAASQRAILAHEPMAAVCFWS